MKERTIKNLLSDDYRLYFYFMDEETKELFVKNASKEGFRYGDGVALYERKPDEIMAINSDLTISFLGYAGHLAFHHPEMASFNIVRMDYAKYAAGERRCKYRNKPSV